MDVQYATQPLNVSHALLPSSIAPTKLLEHKPYVLMYAQKEPLLTRMETARNVQLDAPNAQVQIHAILAMLSLLFKTVNANANLTMKSLLDPLSITSKSISITSFSMLTLLNPMSLQDITSTAQKSLNSTQAQALNST